jgi:hypothetical protein
MDEEVVGPPIAGAGPPFSAATVEVCIPAMLSHSLSPRKRKKGKSYSHVTLYSRPHLITHNRRCLEQNAQSMWVEMGSGLQHTIRVRQQVFSCAFIVVFHISPVPTR